MKCKICNSESSFIFEKQVLGKYNVSYFRCPECFFMQTENPYWLAEAYTSAFTKSDTGLLERPLRFSKILECSIVKHFDSDRRFLDYGGGNGIFVRLMRDIGFDFYRFDKFAENTYSQYFDIEDLPAGERRFEIVTAIELAEHLENPLDTFEEIFSLSDSFFFTTFVQPESIDELDNWWYLSPFHGQHIAFYHRKTLEYIAEKFGRKLYTDNKEIHIITSKNLINLNFEPEELFFETGPFRVKNKVIGAINRFYWSMFKPIRINRKEPLTAKDNEYAISKVLSESKSIQKP